MPNALLSPDISSYADPTGNALLAKGYDPNRAAQSMIATMQGAQNLQRGQVALSSDQIALGRQKLKALDDVLGPIGDNPTLDNAHARIFEAVRNGAWTPDMAQNALGELDKTDGSPQAIKALALQHVARNASIDQQLQMMGAGAPQYVNTGNQLQPVVSQSGMTPGFNPARGGALPLGTSPEFDNSMTTWKDGQGVLHTGTNAQARAAAGAGGAPGGGAGSPFVGAASGRPASGTPAAPGGGAPQAAGGGGIVGPAPGTEEAAKVTAQAGAEQGISLQKSADGAPVRKAMLANLQDDLDKFTSGQGADWTLVGKNWANRNVLPTSMQFDPQSIASQEAFNKQTTQLAQQQIEALGSAGTDARFATNFKANPNQTLSQLGNRQVIQLLQGNEDALVAKAKAWQDWVDPQKGGHSAGTYGQFQGEFNKTYNPRVYQAMYMDPGQVRDMQAHMTAAERQQFANDYVALKTKGYITPNTPRAAQPATPAANPGAQNAGQ